MSIKVTLGEAKTQKKKQFPKLMSTKSGCIVFFTEYGKGICLEKEKNSFDSMGYYSDEWIMSGFADYNEPITLQNE